MSYIGNTQIILEPSNMSAFGTLETAELTPIVQGDWVYGINTQLWNTPVVNGTGATVGTDTGRLRIQSGTVSTNYAYITSRKIVKYRAGEGVVQRITPLFSTPQANSIQLWGIGTISANTPYDGYFIGYNGVTFSIVRYSAGTPTWTSQTNFNGDTCNGSGSSGFNWNTTFGTPCMIKYPYLGYGDIEFFVQNPTTGRWILFHVIQYANTTNLIQISNPSLQVVGYVANSGNTTNLTMYSGSVGTFISGVRSFGSSPKWAADSNKSSVTTEIAALSLKNATTYNGVPNRALIRLNSISVGNGTSSNSNIVVLRIKIGATLGGTPVFNPINGTTADAGVTITNGNSITSVDTAGTTVTSGTYIFNISIGVSGNATVDLTPFELYVAPSEIATITVQATVTSVVGVSVNWSEDI